MSLQNYLTIFLIIIISLQQTHASIRTCPSIKTRKEWNARDASELTRLEQPVEYAIISHTATQGCDSFFTCSNIVRLIQTYHMNRGWRDIGYNFLIGGDGEIYEGLGFDARGSHSKEYNGQSLGIAFIGDYNNESPKEEQIIALQELLDCAVLISTLKRNYKLVGQHQLSNTQSPGINLYHEVRKLPHWREVPQKK